MSLGNPSKDDQTPNSEFALEYERMLDQYYKSLRKNKDNEKKIAALASELAYYRSQEIKEEKEQEKVLFYPDFPKEEYETCYKFLQFESPSSPSQSTSS